MLLKNGKVLGAALDVLEYEKSSFENLDASNEDLDFLLKSEKLL
jgi:D-3-phosphoglycerate dehydrogenase